MIHLEYRAVPKGYAWVFPKEDHLKVGAGVFRPAAGERRQNRLGEELRQAVFAYLTGGGRAS